MQVAILFGSRARGENRPDSDVDIALLGRTNLDLLGLTNDLMQATGINDIDLVDLRRCDPVVGMQALTKGR